MSSLAVVGMPRTAHVLEESVVQARIRGLDVVLVDQPDVLAGVPRSLPAATLAVPDMRAGAVADALRPLAPQPVVSFSELYLVLAAEVREALGLPGVPSTVEHRVRNKAATRARLRDRGLSSVAFAVTTLADLPATAAAFTPPFVVKPVDLTGSIGVAAMLAHSDVERYRELFVAVDEQRELLVEEFIGGVEYSVEGLCLNGEFHHVATTEKRTSGFPAFYETGHLLPARDTALADRLGAYTRDVVAALDIGTAPIHAEVKVSGDRVELIEVHTRFAGDLIPLLVEHAFGTKLFGLFYDALLHGKAPEPAPARTVAGIRFLHEPELENGIVLPAATFDYTVTVHRGGARKEPSALTGIRIVNRRAGHVVFAAPDHAAADAFLDRAVGA
ncbi:MAG TPA: ATP-grasp domain-containing protein [Actinophytocola sp.]|jgi:biotin carboxylase|uniref:ATP-grasp domain-containing protein n=1 Tax=Actinophytocola sp. TaxID=1872138 RepID=UPI002E0018E0|nr:ATP-grasp domain-containing protein [Actinophytocola sp.]